jgi:hypothetical protein
MIKDKNPPKRTPPKAPIKSVQYDLFTSFLTNDDGAVSNALEVWDGIPKYFLTPKQQEKLRSDEGLAKPYDWEYICQDKPCKVRIQPALIEMNDGSYKAFFPSVTEELVEEALKKIFTDQQFGMHDPASTESWVKFTLSMIHRELKGRGRERNRKEIKHAIAVLSRCILMLYQDGKEIYSGAILSDLVTVNRDEYIADSESMHAARLPVFVSRGINAMQYRQFNYARLMDCDNQLTRWLYKRLVHRYRHASMLDTYHFLYSDVKQSSGLLQQGTEQRNRGKLKASVDELQVEGVVFSYTTENIKQGRKIKDEKYTVTATPKFMREQKASNKRAKENLDKAHTLHLVDKSG